MATNYSDKTTPPDSGQIIRKDAVLAELIDQELISKLDSIQNSGQLYKKYSEIYSGGIYALSENSRKENPDWMSQSANSFREIFFDLQRTEIKKLQKILGEYLKKSLTQKEAEKYKEYLNNLYDLFSDIAHHFSEVPNLSEKTYSIGEGFVIKASELDQDVYFKAINLYKEYLKLLVTTALEIHQKIDVCIKENNRNRDLVKVYLDSNIDSKIYFFSKVDKNWLHWLWTEGFLVDLKKQAEDPTSYSYRMPELEYLSRVAEEEPVEIARIINSINISENNFNPEVIDRFLWIISLLPANQIKSLTAKVRDEKWVYLMRGFRKTGYEFESIIKKLAKKQESDAILEIAQAILIVKSKAPLGEGNRLSIETPFLVSDLEASDVFEVLSNIEENSTEKALQIVTGIITEIVELAEPDDTGLFEYIDSFFSLHEVDFFTLEFEKDRQGTYREDEVNIATTVKKLIERTIGKNCGDTKKAQSLMGYINNLPSSHTTWRLKLFSLAQCPEVFKEELRNFLFRLFEVEKYYQIESGTEYKKALKIAFPHLSEPDQRLYISRVLQYFTDKAKNNPEENWHKRTGWEILSSIYDYLKDDELNKCEETFGERCNKEYEPIPMIGKMQSGSVIHKSPVNLAEYSLEQIETNLKTEWTPEKLSEQFKNDYFLAPRGAEGLGDALKDDIKRRTDEYLKDIIAFFDRDSIHPHYLYSLLRGIEEMLRNKQPLSLEQIAQLLNLFDAVRVSGSNPENPFKKTDVRSWLADWITVHIEIADILRSFLIDKETKDAIHQIHREIIKNILSYLLSIKDSPTKEHEQPEYGPPYQIAINSVRGIAYETFVIFTENDGDGLSDDTKIIFKEALSDDSLAVRFVIGRYLSIFYFRDEDFITGLFLDIFPKNDPVKKDIFLAAWEGYLSNTLYDKLFVALKDFYSHAVELNPEEYTPRKYSKGLDESLAIHLALAFVHLKFEITDPLFLQFWSKPNIKRHKEFISFIGRHCFAGEQAGEEWLKQTNVSKDKLIGFWDWALANVTDPEAMSGFGFWVNPDKAILDDNVVIEKISQTLKISNGNIDWENGLLKRLKIFVNKNGEKSLSIISRYLLDSNNNLNQHSGALFIYRTEIKESLKVIYKNGDERVKQKIVDLINILIEKGSRTFWDLKEVTNVG